MRGLLSMSVLSPYPANVLPVEDAGGSVGAIHHPFLKALAVSFHLLQLLFLTGPSYVYATLFDSSNRVHHFNMFYVDYDGGLLDQPVLGIYEKLRGKGFPTVSQSTVEQFPIPEDVRTAVRHGNYWGAIYVNHVATANLAAVLDAEAGANATNLNSLTLSGMEHGTLLLLGTGQTWASESLEFGAPPRLLRSGSPTNLSR
ncbi:hypothetical protein BJX63DRAFT_411892 [Aspergillus granulosus]|uniref:DUF3533 domain-containing protein n=1 Tax=Aspergillus granulosus TaxID=176169 RepID=A0ABR4GWH5_9EURO